MAISLYFNQFTRNDESYEYVPLIKEYAHGCVIAVGTRTAQIMSDIWDTEYYAQYWDEKSQSVKDVGLYCANESGAWERRSHADVDATPEVWALVEKYYADQEFRRLERDAQKEAQRIVKGSEVKVTGGRQNKGAEGVVVVVLERPYGMGYRSVMMEKYGIATSDVMIDKVVNGRTYKNHRDIVWAWSRNCELTSTPDIDLEKIVKQAEIIAKHKVKALTSAKSALAWRAA